MESKKFKIVFFYPSYVVGGAEYLIIRLTEQLSANYNCYIVDYEDGIYRKLSDSIKEEVFIQYKKCFTIPKDAIILTYPSEIKRLTNMISNENLSNKILLWAVHPDNFQSLIPAKRYLHVFFIKNIFYSSIADLINFLAKKNALIVMDGGIIERYKFLYNIKNVDIDFCPIPVKIPAALTKKISFDQETIKCVWLGRISEEKVYSLLKILKDINMCENYKIQFDIIGNGEYEEIIKKFIPKEHVQINYLGTVTSELDKQLLKYDILFGMGTSVLEGAKLSIPSVLVDCSYTEMPKEYRYRWIFESKDYVLGAFLPNKYSDLATLTMKEILDKISEHNSKQELGAKCFDYTVQNHSLENVCKKLIYLLNKTNLTVGQIKDVRAINTFLHKIQGIYNFFTRT